MNKIRIMRAEEEWQRAGAYSVRIQGMNRQYHISLRDEFDEHDGDESRYIVLLDDEYPVATCRFYELSSDCVMIGRVVVLPEYRNQHLGRLLIQEAEKWIVELGYCEIRIDSSLVYNAHQSSILFHLRNKLVGIETRALYRPEHHALGLLA